MGVEHSIYPHVQCVFVLYSGVCKAEVFCRGLESNVSAVCDFLPVSHWKHGVALVLFAYLCSTALNKQWHRQLSIGETQSKSST